MAQANRPLLLLTRLDADTKPDTKACRLNDKDLLDRKKTDIDHVKVGKVYKKVQTSGEEGERGKHGIISRKAPGRQV